ncbi:hypothetical protein GCM10027290_28870 [Micromonospora sonneratiae]|uniref:ABC transporter transmembrane region n=1 Tax=Micromonospora sonneratiae TaxID=1184706 RepID=A0ABW3Y8T5_9ACTN
MKKEHLKRYQRGSIVLDDETERPSGNENWIAGDLLAMTTDQLSTAMEYLHNATNWGLVLVSGSLIAMVASGLFPSEAALYVVLIALVFSVHFFTRSAKGYINVIRFSLVQRVILDWKLSLNALSTNSSPMDAVRKYVVEWRLPLKRSDVFVKMLVELGYGYLISLSLALTGYLMLAVPVHPRMVAALALAVLLAATELTFFLRSPYLRRVAANDDARRDR